MRLQKRLFGLGLAMAVCVVAVLAWPIVRRQVYVADDLGIGHLAMRAFYARSLARGESFNWWPDVLCGYYQQGEGQAGMYHPLHLLLYRTLPLGTAFMLELVLHYPLLLAGTYLFLRRSAFRRDAAMFGALVFSFSGFNLLQFVHPNIVAVIAHLPWMLLAIDVTLREPDSRRVVVARLGIGLLTTSQLLLGHPQAVWLSSLIELLYVAFLLPRWSGSRVWSLGAAKMFGVLGGMVQLLPTWDAASMSVRATAVFAAGYRSLDSLNPLNLAQLVAPYLTTSRVIGRSTPDYALYTGAMTAVLFVWLLVRRTAEASLRTLARGAIVLAAIGLVLALGKYGFVDRLLAYVPLVSAFGVPVRYIVLIHFALAIAAAIAYHDLSDIVERRTPIAWRETRPLVAALLVSLVVAAAALALRARPEMNPDVARQIASPWSIGAGLGLVALATAIVITAARGSRAALAGVIVFAALDQGVYGVSFIRSPYPPAPIAAVADGQAQPPDDPRPFRVQSDNSFLTLRGLQLAGGYVAFRPRRELDALNVQRLRLAGVAWAQVRSPWTRDAEAPRLDAALNDDLRETADVAGGRSTWARVPSAFPRARLLTRAAVSVDVRRDITTIDLQTTALVPEALQLSGDPPGTVAIDADAPGAIRLRVSVPSRQLVVLSESWHHGWRAAVDGHARPVVRVYGDFIGVVVDAGARQVDFSFQPWSLRVGGWLSLLGLGLMLADVILGTRRRPLHS